MRFQGKTAIVTGAGAGIGRAIALAFAREGARLGLCDVAERGLAETADQARALGAEIFSATVDTTRSDQVAAFVRDVAGRWGGLDCAVNAAGVGPKPPIPLAEVSEEDFDRVTGVNLKGVWLSMKYEIEAMLASGGGTICNVASGAGFVAPPNSVAYVASKHGVVGLTKSGAVDYGMLGIRINALCPGYTRTAMLMNAIDKIAGAEQGVNASVPMGRMAEPDEQAMAALFLCSDDSSYMNGHAMVVDGGHSII